MFIFVSSPVGLEKEEIFVRCEFCCFFSVSFCFTLALILTNRTSGLDYEWYGIEVGECFVCLENYAKW